MNAIYCKADNVISWLGEASEDSREAMEFIASLGGLTRRNVAILNDLRSLKDETTTEFVNRQGFTMSAQKWTAVWKLLERSYWTRVWVIQEIAVRGMLQHSTGVLQVGSASVDRADFDFACKAIQGMLSASSRFRSRGSKKVDTDDPEWTKSLRGYPAGLRMFKMLTRCNCLPLPDLEWLLLYTKAYESSDPRDKIYAVLGLACEPDRRFRPDYTKPLKIVLQDLVEFTSMYQVT